MENYYEEFIESLTKEQLEALALNLIEQLQIENDVLKKRIQLLLEERGN